eukprot:63449_1
MALLLGDWGLFLLVVSYIFAFTSSLLCIYATWMARIDYQNKKSAGMNKETLTTQKITNILTIACMWSFVAINLCDAIGLPNFIKQKEAGLRDIGGGWKDWEGWWDWWEPSANSYLSWNVFWAVAKVNLYLVYLYRIYVVSKELKYQSKSMIYYINLFLLLVQFICMILWVYYYNGVLLLDLYDANTYYKRCTIITWFILILDIFISLLLFYLYIDCMKKLFQTIPAQSLQMENVNVAAITGSDGNTATKDEQTEMVTGASPTDENADSPANNGDQWNVTENELVRTATRLFVVFIVSFISSIFYQLMFGIAITEEFYGTHTHTALYYFTFTWNIDSTINVVCLFLSLSIGKTAYYDVCRCDGCCFRCIQKLTAAK